MISQELRHTEGEIHGRELKNNEKNSAPVDTISTLLERFWKRDRSDVMATREAHSDNKTQSPDDFGPPTGTFLDHPKFHLPPFNEI